RGGSFPQVGIFVTAYSLAQLVSFLPMQIAAPVVPLLSNLISKGDVHRARKLIFSSQILAFAIAAFGGSTLVVLSKPLLGAYGKEFTQGTRTLVLLAIAYVVCSPALVTRAVLTATGKMWWQASQTAIWGFLLVIATFILAPRGAEGLAISYL